MPNIPHKDLSYLRSQTKDRDAWSGVLVTYYAVDESSQAFDSMTKETERPDRSFKAPVEVPAFMRVQTPSQPQSDGTTEAFSSENKIEFTFGLETLRDLGIVPEADDQIEVKGVKYEVLYQKKDKIVVQSPFNLDLIVVTQRLATESNGDLNFYDEV